jgi:hypothetical protein
MKKPAKKATKKSPAKKEAKKTASKKTTQRLVGRGTCAKAAKRAIPRKPPGHKLSAGGILIPASISADTSEGVVRADKLEKGLATAKKKITSLMQEIVDTTTEDYEISEIELAASFNADGKFMGFGVGGEATIIIRIRPCA